MPKKIYKQDTEFNKYPRTGIFICLADLITSSNFPMLSSMEQLIFFLVKDSDAAPKTDISVAPAATCKIQFKGKS